MANSTEFGRTEQPVIYRRTRVLQFTDAPDISYADPIVRRNTPLYPALQVAMDEERGILERQVRELVEQVRTLLSSRLDDPDVVNALDIARHALGHFPHVYMEMAINAARHGNLVNATRRIWSDLRITGQITQEQWQNVQVEIAVGDQGQGFADTDVPWEYHQVVQRFDRGLEGGYGYKGYIFGMAHEVERGFRMLEAIQHYVVAHRRRLFQEVRQLAEVV